jgi:hypothetical protein
MSSISALVQSRESPARRPIGRAWTRKLG